MLVRTLPLLLAALAVAGVSGKYSEEVWELDPPSFAKLGKDGSLVLTVFYAPW